MLLLLLIGTGTIISLSIIPFIIRNSIDINELKKNNYRKEYLTKKINAPKKEESINQKHVTFRDKD